MPASNSAEIMQSTSARVPLFGTADELSPTGATDSEQLLSVTRSARSLFSQTTQSIGMRKPVAKPSNKSMEASKDAEIGYPALGRKRLVWTNISVSVPINQKRLKQQEMRQVIEQANGYAKPGELLALMGGSGTGKTSLLNVLAHHTQNGIEVQGCVTVNGEVVSDQEMRIISAYVQQADMFCGTLTVREQLTFSAALRMSRKTTMAERAEAVERALKDMNLRNAERTVIGVPGRVKGISVGEKKRLAFACETLTDPAILFCDEPTSGLDSFMASQVISALRVRVDMGTRTHEIQMMAKQGKTIVCVIHQPSSDTFEMFHKVCFMAKGRVAYFGPVRSLCDFFNSMGRYDMKVPESYNPADHAIAKLSITDDNSEENVTKIIEHFEMSPLHDELMKRCMGQSSSMRDVKFPPEEKKSCRYAAHFHTQTWVLFKRAFLTTLRDPLALKVRLTQIVLTALAVGVVNWRTPIRGETVRNLEGVIYNTARDMTFLFLFPSINLPQYTLLPAIYCLGVYFLTGLDMVAHKVFVFLVVCILLTYVAVSVAYAAATVFGDEALAVTFVPLLALPMLLFGGFYINFHSIPVYFRWLSYLSWFRYGFESLEINQWKDLNITGCEETSTLMNVTATPARANEFCPASTGAEMLTARGINPDNMLFDITLLLAMQCAYRLIGLVALWLRGRFAK